MAGGIASGRCFRGIGRRRRERSINVLSSNVLTSGPHPVVGNDSSQHPEDNSHHDEWRHVCVKDPSEGGPEVFVRNHTLGQGSHDPYPSGDEQGHTRDHEDQIPNSTSRFNGKNHCEQSSNGGYDAQTRNHLCKKCPNRQQPPGDWKLSSASITIAVGPSSSIS